MKLATFRYEDGDWSRRFPDLDSDQTLVLAFAAPKFAARPGPMIELAAAYPRAKVIGCSTAGEIDQTQIRDGSIAVAVVQFERTQVRQAEAQVDGTTSAFAAGQRIAGELASPELRAVLVLVPGTQRGTSPGTSIDALEVVNGLNAGLPAKVIVTGGLAAASERPRKTWVVSGGRPDTDKVVAVGLYGDRVRVSCGWRGGGETGGSEAAVSRSPEGVVQEARAAGAAAANRFEGPVLCMAVSCVGRRVVLGDDSERETEATLEALPVGTAQVGFYSYGEIAPDAAGRCALHTDTMTLTVLSEMA